MVIEPRGSIAMNSIELPHRLGSRQRIGSEDDDEENRAAGNEIPETNEKDDKFDPEFRFSTQV